MNIRKLIQTGLPALMVASALSSTPAQAYDWGKHNYDNMYKQLPDWDHDGVLPEGANRSWEIERLRREADYRDTVLNAYIYQLPLVVEASKSEDGARQARKDVESQKETHLRWEESQKRRAQAIAAADETGTVKVTQPLEVKYPDWATADAAYSATHPKRR